MWGFGVDSPSATEITVVVPILNCFRSVPSKIEVTTNDMTAEVSRLSYKEGSSFPQTIVSMFVFHS